MTRLISLTAAAALLMISGAVAQGYNSTSPSSQGSATQSQPASKSGTTASKSSSTSTASKSTSTANKTASTTKLTRKEINSAVTLDKVHDTAMVETAMVEDANGNMLGTVKSVEKNSSGMAESVHIDFGHWLGSGEHVVSVDAKNARWVADKNIILIRMSKAQVQKLPEIKS